MPKKKQQNVQSVIVFVATVYGKTLCWGTVCPEMNTPHALEGLCLPQRMGSSCTNASDRFGIGDFSFAGSGNAPIRRKTNK
eukprot:3010981-Amphidinium_carterae.1